MSSFEAFTDLVVTYSGPDEIAFSLSTVYDRSHRYGEISGTYPVSAAEAKAITSRLKSVRKAVSKTTVEMADLLMITALGYDNRQMKPKRDANTVEVVLTEEISIVFSADAADALADIITLTLEQRSQDSRTSVNGAMTYTSRDDDKRYLMPDDIQNIVEALHLERE